jgi:DNA-binding NarL/FixJ family response regulator
LADFLNKAICAIIFSEHTIHYHDEQGGERLFRKTEILIVDDMIFFRKEIKQALEQHYDVEVIEASTENEFRMKMNCRGEIVYDLIILDLNLPDGNGLAAMRKFKEKNKNKPQNFIIVSFDINRALIPLAMKSGAGSIIVKPVATSDLINKINEVYPDTLIPKKMAKNTEDFIARTIGLEIRKTDQGLVFFVLAGIAPPDEQTFESGNSEKCTNRNQSNVYSKKVRSLGQAIRPLIGFANQVIDLSTYVCFIIIHGNDAEDLPLRIKEFTEALAKSGVIKTESDLIYQSFTYPDQEKNSARIASTLNKSFLEVYNERLIPLPTDNTLPENQDKPQATDSKVITDDNSKGNSTPAVTEQN